MSVYFWLLCPETKKRVFIGRNTRLPGNVIVDPSEPIGAFLFEHLNKNLVFTSEFGLEEYPDCEDFKLDS